MYSRYLAAKSSISLRNLRRVLRSLEAKFAIELMEFEEKTKSIPRRYRVWGMNAILERRRGIGYEHVYRNRNCITLARPTAAPNPPVNLTSDSPVTLINQAPVKLSPDPPVKLATPPPVNQDARPADNLTAFKRNKDCRKDKETSSLVTAAAHEHFGFHRR